MSLSPRAQAVLDAYPERVLRKLHEGKTIPRWAVNLFIILTESYDQAHSNAIKELNKWK